MKLFISLLFVTSIIIGTTTAYSGYGYCNSSSFFGQASNLNVFTSGDCNFGGCDSDAAVATGGNFQSYGSFTCNNYNGRTPYSLAVAGDMHVSTLVSSNGNIVHGATSTGNVYFNGQGSLVYASSASELPIDFTGTANNIASLSSYWATLATTGSYSFQYGVTTLTCSSAPIQLFNVPGSCFSTFGYFSLKFSGCSTTQSIIVSVSGTSVSLSNGGFSCGNLSPQQILFNFYEATTLHFNGIQHPFTTVAPQAQVNCNNGQAGQLCCKSLTTTNSFEFHTQINGQSCPFHGCAPVPCSSGPTQPPTQQQTPPPFHWPTEPDCDHTTPAPTQTHTTAAPTTVPTTKTPTTVATTQAPTTVTVTTKAPTTVAVTTHAATTVAPTTVKPTTVTPAQTTVAPTTVKPTTVAVTTQAVTTTVAPTTHPATTVAPTTQTATTVAPTTVLPTTAVHTTVAPSTAAPTTTVAPTTVAPTTVAPSTAAPTTTVAPTTVAPTTVAPSTAAPTTTVAPTTVAPSTAAPTTTVAPTTVAPTTVAPSTAAPTTTVAPTTVAPTTVAPSTAAPTTTVAPSTASPTTVAPSTAFPTATPPINIVTHPTTASCDNMTCTPGDLCCDDVVRGPLCYDRNIASCPSGSTGPILCGFQEHGPDQACGIYCYDNLEYVCCNDVLYNMGETNIPCSYQAPPVNNTIVTCGNNVCDSAGYECCEDIVNGPTCYWPTAHSCHTGSEGPLLCGPYDEVCGTVCYDPTLYGCGTGNNLYWIGSN